MSKLHKGYAVVIEQKPYEIPIKRYENDVQDDDISDISDENPEETEDIEDAEEETEPENQEISDISNNRKDTTNKKSKREEINQEAMLKNLAREIITEHSSLTQEKTKELLGEEIIAQAHKTAELIVNHTLETTKSELTNVIAQGYADGFAEGKNEALSVIEPALGKLARLTESITKIQDLMLENFRDGIFSIISEISNKIIHKEISSGDEYLLELFKDAVKSIKVDGFVTVTVSESQVDFVVRNIDLFKAAVSEVKDFRVLSEKDANRGTMIVETAKTMADASYYVQEEKIDAILEEMKNTLVIPQSVEEIEELEKIKSMREENLGYLNSLNDYNNYDGENLNSQDYENLENVYNENLENLSDINIAEI